MTQVFTPEGVTIARPVRPPAALLRPLQSGIAPGLTPKHLAAHKVAKEAFITNRLKTVWWNVLGPGYKNEADYLSAELTEGEKFRTTQLLQQESGTGEWATEEEMPIFQVTMEGNLEHLIALERAKGPAYLHKRGAHGRTILHLACLLLDDTPRKSAKPAPTEVSLDDRHSIKSAKSAKVRKDQKYREIIKYLVESPQHKILINWAFEGAYAGEVAAHIAVVKRDIEILDLLITNGADVSFPRAQGRFFSPDGSLYYGETVLSFAACAGSTEIVEYILDTCGVDPYQIDSHGNTALHILAWWGYHNTDDWEGMQKRIEADAASNEKGNDPDPSDATLGGVWSVIMERMIDLKVEDPLHLLNYQKFTPLLVAVQRGHRHMVHAIIESTTDVQWSYGPVKCVHYPLTFLDHPCTRAFLGSKEDQPKKSIAQQTLERALSINIKPKPKPTSDTPAETAKKVRLRDKEPSACALELAVRNEDIDIISAEPIFRMLLEAKWILYAQDMYFAYFIWALLYALLFSVAVILIPKQPPLLPDTNNEPNPAYISRWDYFSDEVGSRGSWRFFVELLLLVVNLIRVIRQCLALNRFGWRHYLFGFHGMRNLKIWGNVALFVIVIICRAAGNFRAENFAIGIAAIFFWISLLHYTKGSRRLGPLVMIFYRMMSWDLWRFIIIWLVMFLGFSEAMYLQMQFPGQAEKNHGLEDEEYRNSSDYNAGLADWRDPGGALLWMFRWSLSQAEFDDMRSALDSSAAKFYWLLFTILTVILLFNVLIAMLNTTYAEIIDHADRKWHIEWAKIVMSIDDKLHTAVPPIGFRKQVGGEYYFAFNFREDIPQIPVSLVATNDLTEIGDRIRRSAEARTHKNRKMVGELRWGKELAPRHGRRGMDDE